MDDDTSFKRRRAEGIAYRDFGRTRPNGYVRAKQIGRVRIELPRQPAGTWDLYAALERPIEIVGGARVRVPTGWSFRVPERFEVQAISRPELALEHGVTVLAQDQGEPFAVVLHDRDR
ncbi:hypothetical protein A7982_13625 [Minicystis rosea]|nr:hypothetical protein A7982_13625 [Minicystis rosea]